MPDAVVVGSGPNGLAAAIAIAKAGRSVTVYEANDTIGGGARSAELTLPGFVHDLCSAFHPMGAASPFFRAIRLAEQGLHWVQPTAPLAHPLDDGTAVLLERSVADTARGLASDHDADAYTRLLYPLSASWSGLYDEVLRPIVHLPRHPVLLARFGLDAMRSARHLVSRFRGERARALLGGVAAHSFLPLEHPFSAAFALVLGVADVDAPSEATRRAMVHRAIRATLGASATVFGGDATAYRYGDSGVALVAPIVDDSRRGAKLATLLRTRLDELLRSMSITVRSFAGARWLVRVGEATWTRELVTTRAVLQIAEDALANDETARAA
ncbi:MAG TPA: FAD-dependent oxidoreductase [Candidatus Limnocylindria bacterium]|nr:FAD-dependent oxidoreductase [Candidatus Limnocylindria bacterium]